MLLILAFAASVVLSHGPPKLTNFVEEEPIPIQCLNATTKVWGPGPVCAETGKPLELSFGTDSFFYCGWNINKADGSYDFLARVISGVEMWKCRVPMSSDATFYVNFDLQLWGVVEEDHFHLNTHMNFVLHVDDGKLIAASQYPLRDHFHFVVPGTMVRMHGAIRWFHRHSYTPLSNPDHRDPGMGFSLGDSAMSAAITAFFVTMIASAIIFIALYQWILRPRVVKTLLKED